jgi:FkbM family methyltransferase
MPRLSVLQHPILYYKNKYYHHKLNHGKAPDGLSVVDIHGVKFPCDLALGKMTRSMYFGAYDIEIRRIIEKNLRPGDVFVDVGANVGYFSAVGAARVGTSGQVHCFEPVPWLFRYLEQFRSLNPNHSISVNQAALGDKEDKTIIYQSENTGGHSLLSGYFLSGQPQTTHEIAVHRLDTYLEQKSIDRVALIKIDTEGYEFPVLLGLTGFLKKAKGRLPILVIEISHRAFSLTHHTIAEFETFMKDYGYTAYEICGCHKADLYRAQDQNLVFIPEK